METVSTYIIFEKFPYEEEARMVIAEGRNEVKRDIFFKMQKQ